MARGPRRPPAQRQQGPPPRRRYVPVKNFPLQYDAYLRTVDQQRTRFSGSEAEPRTPSQADPRSVVAQSRLEEAPRLQTMWAGYAFATDFREDRGHAYMLEDQTFPERQRVVQQPGTCLHCHASAYVAYRQLGQGDLIQGFERMTQMPFTEARKLATHPVACIDCHDAATMQLRVTRPGFIEGLRTLKAAQGVGGYDVNRMATRQEMRTYVCGQCHVEYYFRGTEKRLVYPWGKGLKVEDVLGYYDEIGLSDWTHAESGAPVLVETIQGRTSALRNLAMDALMELINDLKAARTAGVSDAGLARARDFQRRAQFFLDFVEAENSTGFHAPQEAARILGESINFSRRGQVAVRDRAKP